MRIELEPVDARTALETVLEGILPTAQARRVAIDHEFGGGSTHIMGDSERLQQI
jgi:signal transduction histidine kinase